MNKKILPIALSVIAMMVEWQVANQISKITDSAHMAKEKGRRSG